MIKRILFAADFSEHSARAQAQVIELARALGATIDVLHAIEPFPEGDDEHAFDDIYTQLEDRAESEMARVVEALRAAGLTCTTSIVIEKRWRAINDRAESERADLIVMGSRGHRDGDGNPVGSTSHKVFLTCRVPLLVVRE
ncbi:universal stress protein [Myxococcota bacterium]|nr:universal stress protein [Myxococcota bacterium]